MDASERDAVRRELAGALLVRPPPANYAFASPPRERPRPSQTQPSANKCAHCDGRHAGMCDSVSDRDLDRLSAAAIVMTVARGRRFIEEGDAAAHFYTITDGTARLFKTLPDARQQITSFAGRGDFLGLAFGPVYSCSAEAVDEVRLCRFSRARLHELTADFPTLERRLLSIVSNELVLAQEQMLLLGRKLARERLASFLILRARKTGGGRAPANGPIPVSLPMRRADIADYLGVTIETISRSFTAFKHEGLIAIGSAHQVVILDLARLDACASAG